MRRNPHARFLGGRVGAIPPRYPTLIAVASLLVAMGSMACAGITKSQSNTYRLVYDTTAVSPTQAAAILKELDKIGPRANEATIRKLLQKQGVNVGLIKKISIVPAGQTRSRRKIPLILNLMNPADEPAAIELAMKELQPTSQRSQRNEVGTSGRRND